MRIPQPEPTLGGLPPAQGIQRASESQFGVNPARLFGRRTQQAGGQFRPSTQNHRRKSLAGDLLGAAVRVRIQVLDQARRKTPGGGRHGQLIALELPEQIGLRFDFTRPQKAPCLHQRDEGGCRAHAHIGGQTCAGAGVLDREHHAGRTQFGLRTSAGADSEFGANFAVLRHGQSLRRRAHHLQVRCGVQCQCHRRALARTLEVIGHADADFHFVARGERDRYGGQQNKVATHLGFSCRGRGGAVVHRHCHHA